MLTEQLSERRARLEGELSQLSYRRLLLTRDLEAIDKRIPVLEGAINENDAASRDVATQAAIDKAAAEAAATGKEAGQHA